MKYDELIARIRDEAGVDTLEEAEELAFVVLRTLGERIDGAEADDLYAQLPDPLKTRLLAHVSAQDPAHPMRADQFVERVAEALGLGRDEAERGVRGVFDVVRAAVTPGEFDDVLAQLDRSYRGLVAPDAP
jgi:uncharacterized protein (DUF2267 family)